MVLTTSSSPSAPPLRLWLRASAASRLSSLSLSVLVSLVGVLSYSFIIKLKNKYLVFLKLLFNQIIVTHTDIRFAPKNYKKQTKKGIENVRKLANFLDYIVVWVVVCGRNKLKTRHFHEVLGQAATSLGRPGQKRVQECVSCLIMELLAYFLTLHLYF